MTLYCDCGLGGIRRKRGRVASKFISTEKAHTISTEGIPHWCYTQSIEVFLSRNDDRQHRYGPQECLPAGILRLDPFWLIVVQGVWGEHPGNGNKAHL